jgi:hypothetical protein
MQPVARIALWSVRFLSWQRGLEGFMCLLGIAWGAGILFSGDYMQSGCAAVARPVFIAPESLAMVMLVNCIGGVIGMNLHSSYMRMQTSVISFIVWGLRAVLTTQTNPRPWHALLIFVCFACAELSIYVRIYAGLDKRENQITKRVLRGNSDVGGG